MTAISCPASAMPATGFSGPSKSDDMHVRDVGVDQQMLVVAQIIDIERMADTVALDDRTANAGRREVQALHVGIERAARSRARAVGGADSAMRIDGQRRVAGAVVGDDLQLAIVIALLHELQDIAEIQ